jgi:hypothetical protein
LVTVTLTGPAVATSPAGTATVSVVPPLPTVPPVSWSCPKLTVELATNPDPVSTREETAWPRVPEVGEMPVNVGAGLFTVKVVVVVPEEPV